MRAKLKTLVGVLGLSLLAYTPQAAEHQLSKIHYDAARNVNVLDMVVSIDGILMRLPLDAIKRFWRGLFANPPKACLP
jgi:hypothetical protein